MTKAEELSRRSVVDEYGALAAELAPMKSKQSRFEDLAKTIRSWYVDANPDTGHTATGDLYQALLGAKGNVTVIDKMAAWKALGRAKFIAAATLTMKALEEALPPALVNAITRKEQTGSRSLNVQPLAGNAKEKAA
jgi:hypothetical protein